MLPLLLPAMQESLLVCIGTTTSEHVQAFGLREMGLFKYSMRRRHPCRPRTLHPAARYTMLLLGSETLRRWSGKPQLLHRHQYPSLQLQWLSLSVRPSLLGEHVSKPYDCHVSNQSATHESSDSIRKGSSIGIGVLGLPAVIKTRQHCYQNVLCSSRHGHAGRDNGSCQRS